MSVAFADLARAAYCRRQLYYARRDPDRGPPPETRARRRLAFRYPELRDAESLPEAVALPAAAYRG